MFDSLALCKGVLVMSCSRGVGTAAAAVAMAAAHSRPRKRAGQLYSINAHAQVYDFPAGSESSSIWTRPVFQEVQ